MSRERSWLIQRWLPAEPGRLLDAGCSRGDDTAVYAQAALLTCGIDVDNEDIAAASAAYPGIEFQVAACEAIPYPDESFDTVVCADVIEHVGDEVRALSEIRRVLSPGGLLILNSPHRGWFDWLDPVNYPRRLGPWLWRRAPRIYESLARHTQDLAPGGRPGLLREAEHRHYSSVDLERLLTAAGWEPLRVDRVARTGGLFYALWQNVAYFASLVLRPVPRVHGAVLSLAGRIGHLDYRVPWGRAAFNVAIQIRRGETRGERG